MSKSGVLMLFVTMFLACNQLQHNNNLLNVDSSEVIKPWQRYLNNPNTKLIDYSAVGINYSESAAVDKDLPVFSVADYGAVANDNITDKQSIQKAINAAELAGGGVVTFPKGRFLINTKLDGSPLNIGSSNIVLRGSGNSKNGTHLFMQRALSPADPAKKWTVPAMIQFRPKNVSAPSTSKVGKYKQTSLIIADVKQGAQYIRVEHPERFNAGDLITLQMQNTQANDDFLLGKKPRFNWQSILQKGVQVKETLELEKVVDDRLYFRQPLLTRIKSNYGWKVHSINYITGVGIENLRFTGNFNQNFVHHKNAYHDSGYTAISLMYTTHSWVRNLVFENVSDAANISGGVANNILLNVIEGNRGHASFGIKFGTRNLIGLNIDKTNHGQWHGPGASHLSVGNVIWRFISPESRGIDSHGGNPRFTLFDKVTSKGFGGWGGSYKNLPNHLEGLVFWNFKQTGDKVGEWHKDKFNFWDIQAPKEQNYTFYTAVNPMLIGYEGSATGYNPRQVEHVSSFGQNVALDSLYESQLTSRLGNTPIWMREALIEWKTLQKKYLP
ncbi:DUF4955 domain-containing protein [Paraglaciecola sp.]|uniref:DUF4955 domain-containing protein n=1 Tax=Paraglaciecola sp. TaxID=1920173 RepID=UPI003EF44015